MPATCIRHRVSAKRSTSTSIKTHYYVVHTDVNPSGIVPKGPVADVWLVPHDRDRLG